MKLINHIRQWNHWRKRCLNGPVHKVLVLFGLVHSPTFELERAFYGREKEIEITNKALRPILGSLPFTFVDRKEDLGYDEEDSDD